MKKVLIFLRDWTALTLWVLFVAFVAVDLADHSEVMHDERKGLVVHEVQWNGELFVCIAGARTLWCSQQAHIHLLPPPFDDLFDGTPAPGRGGPPGQPGTPFLQPKVGSGSREAL